MSNVLANHQIDEMHAADKRAWCAECGDLLEEDCAFDDEGNVISDDYVCLDCQDSHTHCTRCGEELPEIDGTCDTCIDWLDDQAERKAGFDKEQGK